MIIPHDQLRPETLEALLEEFVTRDGAVHGHADIPLGRQIEAVKRQLHSGKAVIVFDEAAETFTIALKDSLTEAEFAEDTGPDYDPDETA